MFNKITNNLSKFFLMFFSESRNSEIDSSKLL